MESRHGKFTIEIDNGSIVTHLYGSFNEAGVTAWAESLKETVSLFNGSPFTLLVNEMGARGATPEALAVSNDFNTWLNSKPMIAKAVVYSAEIFKEIDDKNIPARKQQNIKFFYELDLAKQWLTQEQEHKLSYA